jgi:hypothetical protein
VFTRGGLSGVISPGSSNRRLRPETPHITTNPTRAFHAAALQPAQQRGCLWWSASSWLLSFFEGPGHVGNNSIPLSVDCAQQHSKHCMHGGLLPHSLVYLLLPAVLFHLATRGQPSRLPPIPGQPDPSLAPFPAAFAAPSLCRCVLRASAPDQSRLFLAWTQRKTVLINSPLSATQPLSAR